MGLAEKGPGSRIINQRRDRVVTRVGLTIQDQETMLESLSVKESSSTHEKLAYDYGIPTSWEKV